MCEREDRISSGPKHMANTYTTIPSTPCPKNGIGFVAGIRFLVRFAGHSTHRVAAAVYGMSTPSTLSNAILPARNNLVFVKGGPTRRHSVRFDSVGAARLTQHRLCSPPFRASATASNEEQPSSPGHISLLVHIFEYGKTRYLLHAY